MRFSAKNLRFSLCKKQLKHPGNALQFSFFERRTLKKKRLAPSNFSSSGLSRVQFLPKEHQAKSATPNETTFDSTVQKKKNTPRDVLPTELFEKISLLDWAKLVPTITAATELPNNLYIIEFIQNALLKLERKQAEK